MFGLVLTLVLVGVWIYAIMDIITSPAEDVRFLPKLLWLLLVVFFMAAAAILWLLFGRPRRLHADAADGGPGEGHASHRHAAYDVGAGADGSAPDSFGIRQPRIRARRHAQRQLAPDDDPDFLRELSDRIRRGRTDDPPPG
jgi:hypothetical protein